MIATIQHAYYLDARNLSDDATLVELAKDLGLDAERFAEALNDPATHRELERQIAQGKVLGAQGFPSLVYSNETGNHLLHYDYLDPEVTLSTVRQLGAALDLSDPRKM